MTDLDKWIQSMKEDDKSINTIESYKGDVIQFMNFIEKEPEEITKEDIMRYKEYLAVNEMSVKSANRKYISVNGFFSFLQNELEKDVQMRIKKDKLQSQEYLEEMLTKDDFEKLVQVALNYNDYRAVAIFNTLFYTGMRISEALQLKIIDVTNDIVVIKGKGSKHRNVFIPQKLKSILNTYMMYRVPCKSELLFTGKKGPINRKTVDTIIKKYAAIAGISMTKAHAHNFRHLYCLTLIEKGITIDTVADLAGHSNINTTRIYTRKTKNQLLDTINDL